MERSKVGDVADFEPDERAMLSMNKEPVVRARTAVLKMREIMTFIEGSAAAQEKVRELHHVSKMAAPAAVLESAAADQEKVQELNQLQHLTDPEEKPLLPTMDTQWPSSCERIDSAVHYQTAITNFLAFLESDEGQAQFQNQKLPKFETSDWALLAGIRILLTPFYSLLDSLRSETYPTMIYFYPFLCKVKEILSVGDLFQNNEAGNAARANCGTFIKEGLERFLEQHEKNDYYESVVETLEACRSTLQEEFNFRFNGLEKVFSWASMLDPRLRKLNHLSEEEREQAKESLLSEMIALNDASGAAKAQQSEDEKLMANDKRRPFPDMFGDVFDDPGDEQGHDVNPVKEEEPGVPLVRQAAQNELISYLASPSVAKNSPPLQWWQANGQHYPMLGRVARKWFSVVIGTWSPNDRVFSDCGLVSAFRDPTLTNVNNSEEFELQLQLNAKLSSIKPSIDEIAELLQPQVEVTPAETRKVAIV